MTETFLCSVCGESHPLEDRREFDGQELCARCLEEETLICHECGTRIWQDDDAGTDAIHLCQRCYESYYFNCTRCGALFHMDDVHYSSDDPGEEEPLCRACHERLERSHTIQNYYYKPEPVFYGDGPRYFGVELEIDSGGESNVNAEELLQIANSGEERAYCKHDGSLEDGFEIVTHPMTLAYHQESMPWAELLRKAVELGYLSHKAYTCGLHIHVNRDAFGKTEAQQDACIARILYFFEKHWDELLKFSRRTSRQLEQWAARYGYKDHPMEILDHAKKGGGGGRYSAVNLQNRDTIEFRIFRGTLKYNTLIATLQLISKLCDVAVSLSDELLKPLAWTTFVSGIQEPELIQYLKERRLYVNEPVQEEEDD
nr:amidoligase family protein [uncultured Oscillibacter sp.]